MPPRIIKDMSNEDYHSHPAISKSSLDEFNKSPYHYWLRYLADEKPPVVWTDAFSVGSALHSMVLEPQHFDRDFAVKEKVDGRSKAGREYNKEFAEQNSDKIIIDQDQHDLCVLMSNSIFNHPFADEYLDGFGDSEVSLFWEMGNIMCRARPDYITPDGVSTGISE